MKKIITSITLFFAFTASLTAQTESEVTKNVQNNRLKLEVEPGLFFNNGRSVNAIYNVTKNNNLGLGVYMMTSDIPASFSKNMFNNLSSTTSAQVTAEFALNVRYRFSFCKEKESNPYIGMILGWENIKLTDPVLPTMNLSTMLVTPHIGYEIYVYKKMMYLNPQIRTAFYVGQTKSDATRLESLKSYLILPSILVGIRF